MSDFRLEKNGIKLDNTCSNRRFATDIERGNEHLPGQKYKGSATTKPLFTDGSHSLWLEHVAEHRDPENRCYWLMWYDSSGRPTIPLSGVLSKDDLIEVIANIKVFIG